ncbi:MAG: hypothetical protein PUA95_08300 [Lactimicrobium massiliense]|nr:hypothetical protein [Lactimicrobium massiliense]MDD6230721.1 hypothetical protein [Lactimicrobium massiliense]MDD6726874.1 hypothetical protein [Lactimicrobium massiliense]
MMTEKERRAALEDEINFLYTRRFPYRYGYPIRVTVFEFYGLNIYRLYIYTTCFNYEASPKYHPGWQFKFYFTDGKNGTIEIISKTEALAMMKEAEKKEFEHDQVD